MSRGRKDSKTPRFAFNDRRRTRNRLATTARALPDERERQPEITAPTLVLAGRRDLFTPPSVPEQMARTVPGAEIVWFERAGHLLPVEEPDGAVHALLRFLAERVIYNDG